MNYLKIILITGLYAFSCIVLFSGISTQSIDKKSDEIIHLRVVQEMYHSGDLLNPTYNGDAYYNKPPLKMWLTQIPLHILGESNFSYRILDSVLGLVLVTLVLLLSKNIFKTLYPGIFAGFILLLSKELIFGAHGFRKGTQDDLLLVLITASYILLWDLWNNKIIAPHKKYLFYMLVGLACLTKSAAGLLPLIILGIHILFTKASLVSKFYALSKATFLSLLIPGAYYSYHCLKSPVAWKKFFYIELYERATKGMHHVNEPYFYLNQLFSSISFTFPIITACSLAFSVAYYYFRRDKGVLYLLILAFVPVLLFSVPNSRLPWYIFPAYVPLSLLIGFLVYTAIRVAFLTKGNDIRILSFMVLAFLITLYTPRFEKVLKFYLSLGPKNQLAIDKLTHTVLKNPSLKIYVDPSLIDTRDLLGRRKSNRDAFYWIMIQDRISTELDFKEGLVVLPISKKEVLEKYQAFLDGAQVLPLARTRREEALIFYIKAD